MFVVWRFEKLFLPPAETDLTIYLPIYVYLEEANLPPWTRLYQRDLQFKLDCPIRDWDLDSIKVKIIHKPKISRISLYGMQEQETGNRQIPIHIFDKSASACPRFFMFRSRKAKISQVSFVNLFRWGQPSIFSRFCTEVQFAIYL
jgi:hypothetical protein